MYLDDAGSAPVLPEVEDALRDVPPGNPASPHAEGRAARRALDAARDRAADALGTDPLELSFCSGGTEACALALLGAGRHLPAGKAIVTWADDHQAVLGAVRRLEAEGRLVAVLPASSFELPADAGLVSLGLANNELGTLSPVAELAGVARGLGALVHLDACQGPRWLRPPLELCDLASFSGHKLGAGTGGLLYARRGLVVDPLWEGGPQELGRRPGREDVRAAAAVATALAVSASRRDERSAAVAPLAARLQAVLLELGGLPTAEGPRLPNYATACFDGVRGEDVLMALDLEGLAASSGSACASGSLDPSHVLLARGFSLEEALGSLRLTLGYSTTGSEVERAESILRRVLSPLLAHA